MKKQGVTICSLCISPSNEFYQIEICIKQPRHAQFDGIAELRKTLQKILESSGYFEESANVCCRCNNEFKQIYSCTDRHSKDIMFPINSEIAQSSELNTIVRNHERITAGEFSKFSNGSCLAKVQTLKKAIVRLKKLKVVTIDINSTVDYDEKFCKTTKQGSVENVVDGNSLEGSLTAVFEIEECQQRQKIKCEMLENAHTESYQVIKSSNISGRLIQTFLAKKELIHTSGKEISVENIFECDQCSESFDTKQNLNWHKRKIHNRQHSRLKRPFKCDKCEKDFINKRGLNSHRRNVHSGERLKCNQCEKDFSCKISLKTHKELHLEAIHDCDQCNHKFSTNRNLQIHKRNVHSTNRFKCNYCEKDFRSKAGLNFHKEIHIQAIQECDQCSQKFPTNRHLQLHKRHMHSGKRFKCDQCEKDFSSKLILKSHTELHAGIIFQCDQCKRKFPTNRYLQLHKRHMHSGKRFKCDKCEKDFVNKHLLTTHKELHAGNIFNCNQCNRKFPTSGYLLKHERFVHSGNRFKCDQCEGDYRSRWGLTIHKRLLHIFDCDQCCLKFPTSRKLCLHKCKVHNS